MTDEQRAKRVHHHMYETCEGIRKHAERIVALEELIADMELWLYNGMDCTQCPFTPECDWHMAQANSIHTSCIGWDVVHRRMHELGVEVDK